MTSPPKTQARTRAGERPHSTAHAREDGRLSAPPSAARNVAPILEVLSRHVPDTGYALEIASGTGEHAVACAEAFPGVVWQPTDIEPDRLVSIDSWRAVKGHRNMRLAQHLDASDPDWCAPGFDLFLTVNLLHLIPEDAVQNLIQGIARSLEVGGRWALYGPFRTGGGFRSEGDLAFHETLVAHDPAIGYKDLEWVEEQARATGLIRRDLVEMPANNLMLIAEHC